LSNKQTDNKPKVITQDTKIRSMGLVFGVIIFALISFPILVSEYGKNYALTLLLFTIIYFTLKLIYLLQRKSCKKVKAKINDYYLVEYKRYDRENNIPSLDYEVHINYMYEYNNRTYTSQKIGIDRSQYYFRETFSFTDDEKAKNDSLNYLNNFVKSPELYAYVNPLYPKDAVLDININKETIVLNITYIVLALIIFVWLF
jgi:hypothetical protein